MERQLPSPDLSSALLALWLERVPARLGPQFPHLVEGEVCPQAACPAHLPESPEVHVSQGMQTGFRTCSGVLVCSRVLSVRLQKGLDGHCTPIRSGCQSLWSTLGLKLTKWSPRPRVTLVLASARCGVSPCRLGSRTLPLHCYASGTSFMAPASSLLLAFQPLGCLPHIHPPSHPKAPLQNACLEASASGPDR